MKVIRADHTPATTTITTLTNKQQQRRLALKMDPETWDDILHNPTYLDCETMRHIVADVCEYCLAIARGDLREATSYRRIAMICSEPGLGKTHSCERQAKRAGVKFTAGGLSPGSKS